MASNTWRSSLRCLLLNYNALFVFVNYKVIVTIRREDNITFRVLALIGNDYLRYMCIFETVNMVIGLFADR